MSKHSVLSQLLSEVPKDHNALKSTSRQHFVFFARFVGTTLNIV